jgi:FG-GAP-like repeat
MFPDPVFDVDGLPFCATTTDLDHDGIADLIVCSNRENGGLAVLLGRGRGIFEPAVRIKTGWDVGGVLAGDFNADGKSDVIAVQDGRILALLGKGDGTFSEPVETLLPGKVLRSAAVADFDQDGILDLAVASVLSGTVEVLLGRGDGAFSLSSSLAVGKRPTSVATGEFNGDGRADLATVNAESHDVSLLYGREQGRFSDERRVPLEPKGYHPQDVFNAHSVVAGDLNGDGRADIVVSHQDTAVVSVLLGSADEVLIPAGEYGVGSSALSPEIKDVNGDGSMDIVVGSYSSNDVSVLLGDGKGNFSSRRKSGVCEGPGAAITGRFDSDSFLDIAVACRNSKAVGVFRGNGDGTFGPALQKVENTLKNGEPSIVALTSGDFDRNRGADLAIATSFTNQIIVMHDFVNGAPRGQMKYEVGWNPTSLTVGRFDRDRHLDLAVAIRNWDPGTDGGISDSIGRTREAPVPPRGEVVILRGRGDGHFDAAARVAVGYRPAQVKAADLDGDGLDDLVVANQGEPRINALGYLSVILTRADGTFGPERRLFEGAAFSAVAISDFNLDGHPDLVLGTLRAGRPGSGIVAVRFGAGDGSFGEANILDSAWWGGCLAVGDLDADGRPDLVETNTGSLGGGPYVDGATTIFFSWPGGTFARSEAIQAGPPLCVEVNDFNADGRLDLAVLNWSHELSILQGTPGGSFLPRVRFSAAGPVQRFVAADLDGDGAADIAAGVDGGISVLTNRRGRRR